MLSEGRIAHDEEMVRYLYKVTRIRNERRRQKIEFIIPKRFKHKPIV